MANHPLLEPRFVPIYDNGVHYPGSVFTEGQIIKTKDGHVDTYGMYEIKVDFLRTHKRLFRELHWAEKRYEWEMPEYVICLSKNCCANKNNILGVRLGEIHNVIKWELGENVIYLTLINHGTWSIDSYILQFLPSTKEAYDKEAKSNLTDTEK